MTVILIAGLIVAFVIAIMAFVSKDQLPPDQANLTAPAWDREREGIDGPIASGLYRIARPIGSTATIRDTASNPALNALRAKVVASGKYGASLEVYLAYQIASALIGISLLTIVLFTPMMALGKIALVLAAVGLAGVPWNNVSSAVAKKAEQTSTALPEFVDLLKIPIAAGAGVLDSLRFTARFVESPVAFEVRWLLDVLAARTMSETEAFREAGLRIGTPEAISFFTTLGQAYTEGAEISGALQRQAETLRIKSHQARRTKIKKIPVKMVIAFSLHFMPLLMAIAVLPLVFSLGKL